MEKGDLKGEQGLDDLEVQDPVTVKDKPRLHILWESSTEEEEEQQQQQDEPQEEQVSQQLPDWQVELYENLSGPEM